jgi:hypothetical protein
MLIGVAALLAAETASLSPTPASLVALPSLAALQLDQRFEAEARVPAATIARLSFTRSSSDSWRQRQRIQHDQPQKR